MDRLDALFLAWQRRVRSYALLYRFTLATRVLLAAGFIPTGMVKVLGRRFTAISPEDPVGAFFEVLYQSGLYWKFIGLAQVIAGICVLLPATATLGALVFLPIIANIFVITLSYDFRFTPVVTGLMLLANIYLLCWDYDRLRGILGLGAADMPARLPNHRLGRVEGSVYVVGGASAICFLMDERVGFLSGRWNLWLLPVGLLSACVAVAFAWAHRHHRVGESEPHVGSAVQVAELEEKGRGHPARNSVPSNGASS